MRQAMRTAIFAVLSISSIAFAATPKKPQCAASTAKTPHKIESRCLDFLFGDETRTYRLYLPRPARKTALPVLLVLHGGGGSGSAMEGLSLGQFNRVADKHGVLVVYPDGRERSWNDGGVDDVTFVRALVEHIGTRQAIDRRRVYATGLSNGGLMSFRLACDASDFVAAVAPVAANLSTELARECKPKRVTPIAMFNGTDDPMMPWIGGEISVQSNRRGQVLSAQESFERFAKLGDCALPITHSIQDRIPDDRTKIIRHVARECSNRAEVRLYEILGGGHTWPSGTQYLGVRVVGRVSRELNAGNEIWSFVSKYSLPAGAAPN